MLDKFTEQYNVSKTISIAAIPVGKTAEHVKEHLEADKKRADLTGVVKDLIDRYHEEFIEKVLSNRHLFSSDLLKAYKKAIEERDLTQIREAKENLSKELMQEFYLDEVSIKDKKVKTVNVITSSPDKMIFHIMYPSDLYNEEERAFLDEFKGYTGYFAEYFGCRQVIYDCSFEGKNLKHGSVAGRLLEDNFPRFLKNLKVFDEVAEKVGLVDTNGMFTLDGFNLCLSQSGIDLYNTFIGGYTTATGEKVQGFNERINLYNQQIDKTTGEKPLAFFVPLQKMVLVKAKTFSFVPAGFQNPSEVVDAINGMGEVYTKEMLARFEEDMFKAEYDWDNIFIPSDSIATVSKYLTDDWRSIENAWNGQYDTTKTVKQRSKENYADKRRKEFVNACPLSVGEICRLLDTDTVNFNLNMRFYYRQEAKVKILASFPYAVTEKRLERKSFDEEENVAIKDYLDSLKCFERFLKLFDVEAGDRYFTSILDEYIQKFDGFDQSYNKIRNFCTRKPYDKSKFRVTFDHAQFLRGWASGSERANRGFILRDKDDYYLAASIGSQISALQTETDDEDYYEKMVYNQIPKAAKMLPFVFFAKSYIEENNTPQEIVDMITRKRAGGKYTSVEEQVIIEYYKDCISKKAEWKYYDFEFKDFYGSLNEFLSDVDRQSYVTKFIHISKAKVDKMVEDGDIMLFRLYNRNFSKYSKGRDCPYTRYFKMLFDGSSSHGEYVQLKGSADLFYRPASLERRVTHPKNQPIANKNPRNKKKTSTFPYDIIKDRRYTEDRFILNLTLGINSNAPDNLPGLVNRNIRDAVKDAGKVNVIGINRGENNLIYATVVDPDGKILESKSMNVIDGYDYNDALDRRMQLRAEQRSSWRAISDIKNLKQGYIGKVVHELCELILKYDAIVVFDNVTSKFVSSRGKIEKNVYQQIQMSLVNKLNYLCFKDVKDGKVGSFKRGLQLANPAVKTEDIATQNGIVFFLSPWGISGMDPTTGFVNLLNPKYVNVEKSKAFISNFDKIFYDDDKDMFCFVMDYKRFLNWEKYPKKTSWNLFTNGVRTYNYFHKKSGVSKLKRVDLTEAFKELFGDYGINYKSESLKDDITFVQKSDFFKRFMELIGLMVKTRNVEDGEEYVISPVLNNSGAFYDSREVRGKYLPDCCDANAAYNMARKGLILVDNIVNSDESSKKAPYAISKLDWLDYTSN